MWISKQSPICSCGARLSYSMDSILSVQNKKFRRKLKGLCNSSSSRPEKPKVFYTDNSLEFGKACEELSWNRWTSTPHRSETNVSTTRAVCTIQDGYSSVFLQSGLDERGGTDSMECFRYLRNLQDLLSDGKTLYERRFGESFKGLVIPFGSMVEYYPNCAKDQSRIHQFGKKVLFGIFLGYVLHAGGIWKGDHRSGRLWRARTLGRARNPCATQCERSDNAEQEWVTHVSNRRWKSTPFGWDQVLRKSISIQDLHEGYARKPVAGTFGRGEAPEDLRGESDGFEPSDSFSDDSKARKNFCSISGDYINRHHDYQKS